MTKLVARLAAAGCVAPAEEVAELRAIAGTDAALLDQFVARRCTGEPLPWIVGRAAFCDLYVHIEPGVYVPRWQSEPLAERAAEFLPPTGCAVDLGTGCGAIAAVLRARNPDATIAGTELDALAVACARRNGIAVFEGPLFAPLPPSMRGAIDVAVGVLPYVPTTDIAFLPRDVRTFEPRSALDGGADGLAVVLAAIEQAGDWLAPDGVLLLEVGGEQATRIAEACQYHGLRVVDVLVDEEGDQRGVEIRRS